MYNYYFSWLSKVLGEHFCLVKRKKCDVPFTAKISHKFFFSLAYKNSSNHSPISKKTIDLNEINANSCTVSFAPSFGSSALPLAMGEIGIDGIGIWEEVSAMGVVILPVLVLV